jgi:glutaredoxin
VEKLIEPNGFTVIGKPNCPWCYRVRELLVNNGHGYTYLDLSTREEIVEHLVANGIKTVPQVYHDGKRIGGYEVTEMYVKGLSL